MTMMKRLAAGAATATLALAAFGGVAQAQETTSGINGSAHSASGAPLANTPVTVVFEPTNQTFTTTTDAGGLFSVRQLPPGGPYRVTVGDQSQEVPSIGLGTPYQVDLGGAQAANAVAEVVVTGTRAANRQVQTGPRSSFNASDIASLPSFSRDFKDIARLNPFVTLDPSNSNGLIIAGNNYRSNTIYVDGVRQSDDFGLGSNGYPTLRNPLSIDLVQSLNVEVAPYDVSYGTFTGGVLNIATKSGTNEFHGSGFYDYDSNQLGSGRILPVRNANGVATNTVVRIPFKDKTYGFTFGGPIIKDKLFFEFGYENYDGLSSSYQNSPADVGGFANTVTGTTAAQVTQIQQILQSRYGVAAGSYGATGPVTDEKYFGKLTWQITNNQRFVFEAQSTDGSSYTSGSGATALALASNGYALDVALQSFGGYLYSNWTPNLSTEISYTDRTSSRTPTVGLDGTPEFDIYPNGGGLPPSVANPTGVAGSTTNPVIYAGTNYSYQANNLTQENKLFRFRANYTWGAHTFLAGYEHEDRFASDLFIQRANGVATFTSIANLQAGFVNQIQYANAADNSSASGVVPLDYTIHTAYIQDEWRVLPTLTLRAGLRDEYYEQSGAPPKNAFLQSTFGIDNTKNLDGLNSLLPRFGFNWRPVHNFVLSGGVGRFSGGSPDVYINNAFNGSGNLLGSVTCNTRTSPTAVPGCAAALQNFTGTIPQAILTANTNSANAGTGLTALLSPDFEPLTVWKTSLSAQYTLDFTDWSWTGVAGRVLGDGWRLHADYLHQWTDKGLLLQDLDTLTAISGTAPDGRPIFNPTRPTVSRYDIVLANTDRGFSDTYAIGGGKTFANGIDFDVTYTHTRSLDQVPLTSSVANSNYRTNAFSDPNNPGLAVTNYSIPDQTKVQFGYSHAFFGDNFTRLRVYGQRRSGLPYSYTYQLAFPSGGTDTTGFGLSSTAFSTTYPDELVYVPKTDSTGNVTATSDPKVSYAFASTNSTAPGPNNVAGFNEFLKATGLIKYAGEIAPRNAFNSKDVTTVDLQLTQEIPAFFPTHAKAEVYFSIFNFGNLLNSSWGVLEQYDFPYQYQAIQAKIIPCSSGSGCAPGQTNQYQYTGYGQDPTRNPKIIQTSSGNVPPSTWALKMGIRFKF